MNLDLNAAVLVMSEEINYRTNRCCYLSCFICLNKLKISREFLYNEVVNQAASNQHWSINKNGDHKSDQVCFVARVALSVSE